MQLGAQAQDPRRRLIGIGAVVAFHALLIWALAAGLAHKMISILPPPIETRIIEELKTPDEPPPPPPPPALDIPPPPFVPPPEINIATPAPKHAISTQSKAPARSEEHTSELQSLMRISYAVFCLKKKNTQY